MSADTSGFLIFRRHQSNYLNCFIPTPSHEEEVHERIVNF